MTLHRHGRDETLGVAYCDHDLVVFLEAAGVADPDVVLDDPRWWRVATSGPTSVVRPGHWHEPGLWPGRIRKDRHGPVLW
ncbi:hypothetical protein [Streptomyces flavidovirens]|uniref:Uncharacterized protein n=1 Tax=Streptomyces flavidovirens TaxID=67298 RepID=A0ABW6RIL2_9ACTN